MTFDEYIGLTREFVSANYRSRLLKGISLIFTEGDPMYLPLPDEREIDDSDELHPVEQAIIDVLRHADGLGVTIKKLLGDVKRATRKSEPTIYRYIRRLKADKIISEGAEGYALLRRTIAPE